MYHISIASRVDPDQAALTRAVRSGSALFAKALKGISMRKRVNIAMFGVHRNGLCYE